MHSLELVKPDGRALTLYARGPIAPVADVPSPFREPLGTKAHLRWHPLRGEWVTYAAHRQDRTFQPPPEYDPLAATVDRRRPTLQVVHPRKIAPLDFEEVRAVADYLSRIEWSDPDH